MSDANEVFTSCRICGARCGLAATVVDNRVVRIGPDKQNPSSWRDFCVKGRTAHQLVEHPRRILAPMRRVGDRYVAASYDEAWAEIGASLSSIISRDSPDAVGCYYGNPAGYDPGSLGALTQFMRALGSRSVYNWGSVDTNAKAVVCGEMFGVTMIPMIPDVDNCDCFLFIGTNPAESKLVWISSVPDGWRRVLARVDDGADLIVVDPYRTQTAAAATQYVAVAPGQDWALLLGVIKVVIEQGLHDAAACAAEVGFDAIEALVARADLPDLARRAGVEVAAIETIALRFAGAHSAIALTRTGVSQTSRGTLALWLSEVLTVITGNWDIRGGRHFQRGAIKPKLPPYDPTPPLSRVARRPAIEGCFSIAELPAEIRTPGPGQLRALFIQNGNPVVAGPQGDQLDAALADLELLVAVDMVQRESHRHAHWLIPGTHWLERDEFAPFASMTTEVPFVQFTPRAVDPPEAVLPETEFFHRLGAQMGLPGYLTGEPFSLMDASRAAFERAGHASWQELLDHPHGMVVGEREYGNARAMLRTPDHRINLAPARFIEELLRQLHTEPSAAPDGLTLQLGNRRRLSSMNSFLNELPGPRKIVESNRAELHRDDADRLGIADGDRVRVRSAAGAIELTAAVTDAPRPGVVIVEHGWGSRVFDPNGTAEPDVVGVNRNLLTAADEEDPLSLMSAFNETWVTVEPLDVTQSAR
ncbi:molybdopterin-dependent oxidoreductase [Mycobacterium sp. NBC_00419]|uniref:molybdopterin-containing oxidoreductase family protein n=1 Tax=Mycobacterium sp. NBC_00419 TaxID=2975989 RepID=UPI002E241339